MHTIVKKLICVYPLKRITYFFKIFFSIFFLFEICNDTSRSKDPERKVSEMGLKRGKSERKKMMNETEMETRKIKEKE